MPQDPVTFDAEWYLATFPDVALSGLSPEAHYHKYGRLLGRAPNAGVAGSDIAPPAAVETGPGLWAGAQELARFPDADAMRAAFGPLAGYARMFDLDAGAFSVRGLPRKVLADGLAGAATLGEFPKSLHCASAWFANSHSLRLLIERPETPERGQVLRLYQAPPEAPGALCLVGGASLSGAGPGFVDASLLNPLMPVLIEFGDDSGFSHGFALLPFPSLARGGMHGAERAALQIGRDPMADLWRLSRAYLAELLAPDAPAFAIARLAVERGAASGTEALLSTAVQDWLAALFGLDLAGTQSRDGGHLTLSLSAEMLPTCAALVSRRMRLPDDIAQAAGPFLVAEEISHKPRWSVALPDGEGAELPRLIRTGTAQGDGAGSWLAPLHLAIRQVTPEPVSDILTLLADGLDATPDPEPETDTDPAKQTLISVALKASDATLAARALTVLAQQRDVQLAELVLCANPGVAAQVDPLASALFASVITLSAEASLDEIAGVSASDMVLLLDEAVVLYDPATLAGLSDILTQSTDAGAVSCALLHEAEFRKSTRVQVASAGLFPTGLSFVAAPRLSVAAPDVLQALPRATYPVLANSFELCLLRRAAITATAPARAGDWGDVAADLKFGLDAQEAGWRSLCTTRLRGGTTRAPRLRDEIDPLGLAVIQPAQWEELISGVTLVRELYG